MKLSTTEDAEDTEDGIIRCAVPFSSVRRDFRLRRVKSLSLRVLCVLRGGAFRS
jgi:hypothetical protein